MILVDDWLFPGETGLEDAESSVGTPQRLKRILLLFLLLVPLRPPNSPLFFFSKGVVSFVLMSFSPDLVGFSKLTVFGFVWLGKTYFRDSTVKLPISAVGRRLMCSVLNGRLKYYRA